MMTNHSLKYHFYPQKGWINDPNGLSFFKGQYHLFYQHCPGFEYPGQAPHIWGHAVTQDFLHFEELPLALDVSEPYDCHGVWSGTAIEKDGKLYVFYASIDKADKQTVSVAFSEDGVNFTKYAGNPVISNHPCNTNNNFRDPAIFIEEGICYLVIASADADRKMGTLVLYRSTDCLQWELVGNMLEYPEAIFCECPSFVKHGDGYLLACSVCKENRHYFEVVYGDFDGRVFTPKITSHFQKGPDEYAGQVFSAPDGRSVLISWIPGWAYQPKEKCIGCLSLPCELTVEGDKIKAYPIAEVRHLLDKDDTVVDDYIREKFVNKGEEVEICLLQKP